MKCIDMLHTHPLVRCATAAAAANENKLDDAWNTLRGKKRSSDTQVTRCSDMPLGNKSMYSNILYLAFGSVHIFCHVFLAPFLLALG